MIHGNGAIRGHGCMSGRGGMHGASSGTLTGDYQGLFPDVGGQEMQHKLLVELIFLVYRHVSSGSEERILLMQIACAIVQMLNDVHSIDAVQLMRTGWLIYLHMQADRE